MELKIPKELSTLPINKILPQINLSETFILIGATGSGKTMLIPALISSNNRIVILRQPTRKIAQLTYQALQKFWGDQLSIGLITSEMKDLNMSLLNSYNLVVITDGVLSYLIKKLDYSRLSVVFDEIHWTTSPLEIELSVAESYKRKNPTMQIVLLSATVDPYIFASYVERTSSSPIPDNILRDICIKANTESINLLPQSQRLKIYYSEGITFPIEKAIIKVSDIEDVDKQISEFCYRMVSLKDKGLVFLSTRNEIAEAAKKYAYILPTFYVHADTPVNELIDFLNNNKSGAVFATIALSTSVTLPFLETLILDKSNDSSYIEILEQKIDRFGTVCDFNEILQKAGRVGRTRPGKATLITSRDITWNEIKPTNIIPPLKKELPLTAALIAASHEINIADANLLSNLSKSQIENSLTRLKQMKFLDEANNITTLGKRALSLPLEPNDAKLLLSTPTSFIPATSAFLSFPSGMFYLLNKPPASLYAKYNYNSIPITKIILMQDIIANKHNLKVFAHENSLNYKRLTLSLFNFHQIGRKFSKEPAEFEDDLLSLNFYENTSLLNSYRSLIYILMQKFPALLDGKGGFNVFNNGRKHYSFFSDKEFFTVPNPDISQKVSAKFSLFQSGKGGIFGRLQDATLPLTINTGVI